MPSEGDHLLSSSNMSQGAIHATELSFSQEVVVEYVSFVTKDDEEISCGKRNFAKYQSSESLLWDL